MLHYFCCKVVSKDTLEFFYLPGYLWYEDFLAYKVLNLRLGYYTDFIHDFFIVTGRSPKRTVE